MTISELIEELQKIEDVHGDLAVEDKDGNELRHVRGVYTTVLEKPAIVAVKLES